jgi:PAS domain S-box-containing protein
MEFDTIGQLVLENMSELVYVRDLDKNIIYINPASEKITGLSLKQALGKKCYQLFGDGKQTCKDLCPAEDAIRQNRVVSHHEVELKTCSGETRQMQVTISPLSEKKKKIGGVVVMNDITHLKKMQQNSVKSGIVLEEEIQRRLSVEEELKKINRSLVQERQIFISGTAVVFKWKNQEGWPVEYVSPNVESVLGYSASELLSGEVPYADIIPAEDIQRVANEVKENSEKGVEKFEHIPYRIVRKDGKIIWVADYTTIIRDDSRKITHYLGYIIDITDMKKALELLKESEQRFKDISFSMADWVWEIDKDGRYTYVSGKVKKHLGYEPDEFIGKRVFDFSPGREAKRLKKIFVELAAQKKSLIDLETQVLAKNGEEIFLLTNGVPILDETGELKGFRGVNRNITERKREQENRQRLEEQLHQARKMEAIGDLAGGIAHDFNNILCTIMGYAELALDDIPKGTITRDNLEKVAYAAERAKELVKQILTFSRKGEKEFKPLYLHKVVEDSIRLIRASLPATIEIRKKFENTPNPILANLTQVHQVIINICTNAAHAMKGKAGILEIGLREVELCDTDVIGKELQPGRYQQLIFTDNGHGMTPDVLKRIFEPYFTTKNKDEGTGMGLAVVHGIVKSHNGDITVYSEPGKGTTFQVFFPVSKDEKIADTTENQDLTGGNEHLLFVDDEQTLADIGKQMLERLGYKVDARTSSIEALAVFRQHPHKYDLVITDHAMPNMTGLQMAEQLKQIRPDIPVIICTGFSESIDKDNYRSKGINGFVMKPFIKKDVAPVIRDVLEGRGS